MSPIIVEWPAKPLVTLSTCFFHTQACAVQWHDSVYEAGGTTLAIGLADYIRIKIEFRYKALYGGGVNFYVWLHTKVNGSWVTVNTYQYYKTADAIDETWYTFSKEYDIPISEGGFSHFKVKVSMDCGRNYDLNTEPDVKGSDAYDSSTPRHSQLDGEDKGIMELEKEFIVYQEYFGDFSLDYIPVTLLYCPPGQDMYSAFEQVKEYGTITSVGFEESVGTSSGEQSDVKGGMDMNIGPVGTTCDVWSGGSSTARDQISTYLENKVSYSYRWKTYLIADNQRVIGRRYWGPLGDIFVLLKNPWFGVGLNENNEVILKKSQITEVETQILIMPAHKLLRPNGDPIAGDIPWETRRRILELDPFIVNLDKFFEADPSDPSINIADPNVPLEEAADPYADPSVGRLGMTQIGNNRAEKIARYSISNGVEMDFSLSEGITVSDQHTNTSSYFAERSDTGGGSMGISFFGTLSFGGSGSDYTGEFAEIKYFDSAEYHLGVIETAICKLIRNQNQADLEDIEIWWDKQFSTFMFRKVKPSTGGCSGGVFEPIDPTTPGVHGPDIVIATDYGTGVNGVCGVLLSLQWLLSGDIAILKDLDIPIPDHKITQEDDFPVDFLERVADVIIEADLDIEMILTKTGEPPKEAIHKTMTDSKGRFDFRNVRSGVYLVQFGDKVSKIHISAEDAQRGLSKRKNFFDVKRVIDLRQPVPWEIAQILNTDIRTAERLCRCLKKQKDLNEKITGELLTAEKLKLSDMKRSAVLKFTDGIVRPGMFTVGGWITDQNKGRVRFCPVHLVETTIIDERFNDSDLTIEDIEEELPENSFYKTRTDQHGKYAIVGVKPGEYHLFCGDKRTKGSIRVTESERMVGKFHRVDIDDVRRVFKVADSSVLELRAIFDITLSQATRLHKTLLKEKIVDEKQLADVLVKEGIPHDRWKMKAGLRFRRKELKKT